MSMHAKIGGSHRSIKEIHAKVSGVHRSIKEGYIKEGGTWRQFFTTVGQVFTVTKDDSIILTDNAIATYTAAPVDFSPTISGREAASGFLVTCSGLHNTNSSTNASASADTDIWVEVTTGQATIYCGARGTVTELAAYIDETGTSQGDPGEYPTGTAIFTLNEEPDEIRITKSGDSTSSSSGGSASITKIGSFTDNSFFSPSLNTDYGYGADTTADDTADDASAETGDASVTVTVTFRKSGYTDYSISFSQDASSSANKGIF